MKGERTRDRIDERPNSPTRRLKRKLTPFLCQEMLFEYAMGGLDEQRRMDIAEFLPSDRSSQEALEEIRRGIEYGEKLARASVSDELMERLSRSENGWTILHRAMDWNEWPETLRWSTSAIAVSVLVAGLVTVVPWNKMPSFSKRGAPNTIILAEIPKSTGPGEAGEAPLTDTEGEDSGEVPGMAALETSGDEHITGDEPAAHLPLGSVKTDSPKVETKVAAAETKTVDPTPAPDSTGAAAAPAKESKPKGFVFRAFMNVASVDEVTPEIRQHLIALGGEKAGEVDLGWRKGAGSYFHFTVPESNEEQVTEMLRTYGPVRISKDPHPRVMPSGQVRFILWVEPAQPTNN